MPSGIWHHECFYCSTVTLRHKRLLYMFYKKPKVLSSFGGAIHIFVLLFEMKVMSACLCTLKENEAFLLRACFGRVLLYIGILYIVIVYRHVTLFFFRKVPFHYFTQCVLTTLQLHHDHTQSCFAYGHSH